MSLTPEKKAFIALGAAALAVLLLLPFVFRELEPDYNAAYSMDPSKKRRFAAKDEKPPELPNLPPASAPAASAPLSGPAISTHRPPPAAGRARIATPDTPDATSAADMKESGANSAPAPRLVPGTSETGTAGSGSGAAVAGKGYGLEDARFGTHEAPRQIQLDLVAGGADAARMAENLGLKNVAGLALAASADMSVNVECAKASRELKPKLVSASAEHKRAADELKASACPADACGRYAADCAAKERTDEEARVSRRRCACDRLACRKTETCRTLDKLACEQEKACALGKPVSCSSSCS